MSLGLVLSALPFVGACNQQTSNAPASLLTAAQAESSPAAVSNAAAAATDQPAVAVVPETAPPPPEEAPAVTPAPNATKSPLPLNLKPSAPVAEVAKLGQSGVDENVILTYVNNSASFFNLSSDEIIYLSDLGIPGSVVTAMIQRDQVLKQTMAEAAQAQNAAAQAATEAAQASAPAYVNPPQAEPEPVAAQPVSQPPPANVSYNYFYDSLSPYGTWLEVDGYGWCWQPTVVVVNRGWRPYFDRGRWLYTDAGWYWHSDYSWGYIPFHYGRWFHHARWGWCWNPGYVWGPAWVTWRYSGDYCGWAPLPPAAYYRPGFGFSYYGSSVGVSFGFGLGYSWYNFVPWNRFCDYRPWHHRVPTSRVTQVFNNTTVVNNIITGDNNTIINRGVPVDEARRHTRSEIRQVAIRDSTTAPTRSGRGERLERDGRTLVVKRPQIPESAASEVRPARLTATPQTGHSPVAGAGAAAQLESRGPRQDRAAQPALRASPPAAAPRPTDDRSTTKAPRADGLVASPAALPGRPALDTGRNEPRSLNQRPSNPTREPTRERPGSLSAPLTGSTLQKPATQTPVPQAETAPKNPPGSLVVIGRRDAGTSQLGTRSSSPLQTTPSRPVNPTIPTDARSREIGAAPLERAPLVRPDSQPRSTHNWTPVRPAPVTPSASAPSYQSPVRSTPSPSTSFDRPTVTSPRYERPTAPAYRPASPGRSLEIPRSSPSFQAPRVSPPSYSAPASRPTAPPTPSFSPRVSAPAPSFSPRASAPAPVVPAIQSRPSPPSMSAPPAASERRGRDR